MEGSPDDEIQELITYKSVPDKILIKYLEVIPL